jgi:hypothetical protein
MLATILFRVFFSSCLLSKNLKIKMYRTIILLAVLYGCETWSAMLREERSLRMFEKRVMRRITGRKREEVVGDWRRLHNDELPNLYASPNIIRAIKLRRMRWVGHVAYMGEMRNAYNRHTWEAILEWILGKYGGRVCPGFIWLRIGTNAGPL